MKKKAKGAGSWFPVLILLVMTGAAAAAGIHAAGITKSKSGTPSQTAAVQEQKETETIQGKEILGVLRSIQEKEGRIRVYQADRMEEVELTYNGATKVQTRYGNEITMLQLKPGMLVRTVCRAGTNILQSVREDEEAWIYKGIVNLEVDRLEHIMTIGDQKYQYDDQLTVVNGGVLTDLNSLSDKDVLTARGMDEKIYSLEVTRGHGILAFSNYEDFVGGSIEVGYEIFDQIVPDREYELREGSYKLIMRHGSLAVNKYITITRGQTLTVDLNEYRNEAGKSGLVTFYLNPEEAELYLDNELVDASVPVELGYGEYILEVQCEGYETCSRLLSVSMPTQTIRIDLADSTSNTSDDTLSDLNPGSSYEDSYSGSEDNGYEDEGDDIIEIGDEDTSEEAGSDGQENSSGEGTGENEVITDRYIMIRKPEGAEVYFDGAYVGTAPVQLDKVTGEHQITFKRDGYISKTYTIEVENDGENPVFSFPELTKE